MVLYFYINLHYSIYIPSNIAQILSPQMSLIAGFSPWLLRPFFSTPRMAEATQAAMSLAPRASDATVNR